MTPSRQLQGEDLVLSTDDKKTGLDDSVETPTEDTATAAGKRDAIEDAEVIAEITPEGESPETDTSADTPDDATDDATDDIAETDDAVTGVAATGDAEAEDAPTDADAAPDGVAYAPEETADIAKAEDTEDESEPAAEAEPDPEPVTEPEPTPIPTPTPVAAAPSSSGAGVMSTVAGGALAAVLGFGAAQFIDVDWMGMSGLGRDPVAVAIDTHTAELTALRERLAEVEAAAIDTSAVENAMTVIAADMTTRFGSVANGMTALNDQVGGLNEAVTGTVVAAQSTLEQTGSELTRVADGLGAIETRLTGVGDHLAGVDERLAEVDARLVEVEKRPLVESSDTAKAAFGVYERQLNELRATLEAQRADALKLEDSITEVSATAAAQMTAVSEQAEEQLLAMRSQTEMELQAVRDEAAAAIEAAEARAAEAEAKADARAQLAVAQASLAQVEAALNAGIAYEVALPALASVVEVPAVLSENGATGIPTLLMLQESYTPAARAALDASVKDTMGEDPTTRIMAFLKTQTGVRSLEAREGNDPDAVLSRMTVAVEAGDLAAALAEVPNLPEAGQAALADWTDAAQARLDAEAALPELAASVNNS